MPEEFTLEHIKANSPLEEEVYSWLLKAGQPFRSFSKTNYHMSAKYGYVDRPFTKDGKPTGNPDTFNLDIEDDDLYYNTEGVAAAYWADFDLPKPTQDIRQMRKDIKDWGYCMIKEVRRAADKSSAPFSEPALTCGPQALSAEQLAKMQKRTFDQLEGEVLAGVAAFSSPNHPGHQGNQQLHGILNKDTPCGIFAKAFVQVRKRTLLFFFVASNSACCGRCSYSSAVLHREAVKQRVLKLL